MSRILHLEGNPAWLSLCRRAYTAAAADCAVFPVPEIQQAAFLPYILPLCRPSFLVLTGHDRADGASSFHTQAFCRSVRAARLYEPDPERLVIFAGACSSRAEDILKAGANFASSPGRIPISVLDPVLLALAASAVSPGRQIEPSRIIAATLCGPAGIAAAPN